jgi:hypothetical protein
METNGLALWGASSAPSTVPRTQRRNSSLASERAGLMPPLDHALDRFSREFLKGVTR